MMRFMAKADLTASDWRLLAAASVAQTLTAFGLRVVSLPTLQRAGPRLRSLAHFVFSGPEPRIIWAIEASGRRLQGVSTCLVRALVAELALSSPERPLRLTIGVRRAPGGDLESHAWVVDEADANRVLIGGSMAEQYEPLVARGSLST